jgi:predicted membrane metal-binding protein
MPQSRTSERIRVHFARIPLWQAILIAIVALAIFAAVAVIAFGVFLVMLAASLVAGIVYALFGRWWWPRAGSGTIREGTEIEVDYRVIDTDRDDRSRKSIPRRDDTD